MDSNVTVKQDDVILGRAVMNNISYEHRNINIAISCTSEAGFDLSIFDKSSNIMRYYNIMDGVPKLTSKEDVTTGDELMLRDDIRDKVFDYINADFVEPRFIVQEQYNWIELNMDANDVNVLASLLEKEFNIDYITPDAISKWNTVADIVNYIEDQLECALHDVEEEK